MNSKRTRVRVGIADYINAPPIDRLDLSTQPFGPPSGEWKSAVVPLDGDSVALAYGWHIDAERGDHISGRFVGTRAEVAMQARRRARHLREEADALDAAADKAEPLRAKHFAEAGAFDDGGER